MNEWIRRTPAASPPEFQETRNVNLVVSDTQENQQYIETQVVCLAQRSLLVPNADRGGGKGGKSVPSSPERFRRLLWSHLLWRFRARQRQHSRRHGRTVLGVCVAGGFLKQEPGLEMGVWADFPPC